MTEHDARRLAKELMEKHGLLERNAYFRSLSGMVAFGPWKFVIDRRPRDRGGHCRGRKREIGVSAWLIKYNEEPRVRNTILHEIAHALTLGHKHDRVWKRKAQEIGCDGLRCYDMGTEIPLVRPPMPFNGVCPAGHTHDRQRRPKVELGCYHCSTKWSPGTVITWTDNATGERATRWGVETVVEVTLDPVDILLGGA